MDLLETAKQLRKSESPRFMIYWVSLGLGR